MNPFPIDAYAYSNRLRFIHPGEKILFAALTIALCLTFRSPVVSAGALLVVAGALWRLAGIGPGVFWYFVRLPLGFIFVGVLTVAVVTLPPGAPNALVSVPLGALRVGITSGSLAQAVRILSASLGSVGATLFLALTTPMTDITDQLRRWHVPVLFTELMVLVYRFTFVLLETAHTMHLAQEARLGYSTMRRSLRSMSMLISNLYLRANARAAALFTGLSARGYDGELRVLLEQPSWAWSHLAVIAAAELLLLVAGVAARAGGLL